MAFLTARNTAATSWPSTIIASTPYEAARWATFSMLLAHPASSISLPKNGTLIPYRLFSITATRGTSITEAMFIASWKLPVLVEPSPKKEMTTLPVFLYLSAMAAPTAGGMLPPTIPVEPKLLHLSTSAMCIEPPRPLQYPVSRPISSAIMRFQCCWRSLSFSAYLLPTAPQCPCPRWVEPITSPFAMAAMAPVATASWPA